MIELAFFGRSSDSQSIVLTGPDGERFSVAITDALRAAVRRVAPSELTSPTGERRVLRPREIQALLREGLSAAEIAEREGMDLADVVKYESPVLAERAWAISRAQLCRIGDAPGTPILEDLVINRLAARGVDSDSLSWNAARKPDEDWEVYLTFIQGGVERQASWQLISDSQAVKAIDEEATWLTEAAAPPTPVSAFFPSPSTVNADIESMEQLVEKANSERGRPQLTIEEFESVEEDLGTGYFESRVQEETEAAAPVVEEVAPAIEIVPDEPADAELFELPPDIPLGEDSGEEVAPRRSRRRPVPSWDEIVFGSKTD